MNLKLQFLTKNCWYIVPSPSTTLILYFTSKVNTKSYFDLDNLS